MPTQEKSLVTFRFNDLLNNPIQDLHYQVKSEGKTVADGATNSKGESVKISRAFGTVLSVYVKRITSSEMKKIGEVTLSTPKPTYTFRSPKILIEKFTPQKHEAPKGAYKPKTYKVKSGDTLDGIAKQHHTTVGELVLLNHIKDKNKISVGQTLRLPLVGAKKPVAAKPKPPATAPVQQTQPQQTQPQQNPPATTAVAAAPAQPQPQPTVAQTQPVVQPVATPIITAQQNSASAGTPVLVVLNTGQPYSGIPGSFIGTVIASHESLGDYTIFNRGTVGAYAWTSGHENLANRTISSLISAGQLSGNNIAKRFAIGKYQIIPDTLTGAKNVLGLSGDELFTNEMQEYIFSQYLVKIRRPKLYDALTTFENVDLGILQAAKEWASIGVPYATTRSNIPIAAGASYYSGVGGNQAHTTPQNMRIAIQKTYDEIQKCVQLGLDLSHAYDVVMKGSL